VPILTPLPVIDPISVADVEAKLGAVSPNRVLYKPREHLGEGRIKRTGVNLLCGEGNDVGAATWLVAAGAIGMSRFKSGQDPGSMQKIMDQRINRNELDADFEPLWANVSGADQNVGQSHG
jgi:hypothetical protein